MGINTPMDDNGRGSPADGFNDSGSNGFGDTTSSGSGPGNDIQTSDPADVPPRSNVDANNLRLRGNASANGTMPQGNEQSNTPMDNGYIGNAKLTKDAATVKPAFPIVLVIGAIIVTKLLKLW